MAGKDESSSLLGAAAAQQPAKLWGPWAFLVISFLFLLKGCQPIVTKMSMVDNVIEYRVVVMSAIIDVCKIAFCCIALPYQLCTTKDPEQKKALTAGTSLQTTLQYALPSLCFMFGSNVSYYALQFVDGTTFLLFSNTKIVFTVLLHSTYYKYEVTMRAWMGALLVGVGCTLSQLQSQDSDPDTIPMEKKAWGIGLTILGVLVHVFASVLNEVLFKNQVKQSLWLQNLQLYIWSLLLNCSAFGVQSFLHGWQSPLYGFNDVTWALVAMVSVYGLAVSICLKRLDNVVYMYVTLMTPFLTAFLSWWFGTDPIYAALFVGMGITIAGVCIYYYKP